ncbi:MAG: hypothetical protein KDC95_07340 [Planctomycetes bacterium]|nr:hypothetical protein [Planctomycetota bacterium]
MSSSSGSSQRRLLFAALAMDTSFFAALATLPFFVKRAGVLWFGDAMLGVLLASLGLSYVVGALFLPRFQARFDPVRSTRFFGALSGALFVVGSWMTDPVLVFVTLALGRAALGGFWPTLMAMVGSGDRDALGARIARFNTWWGTGKAIAFLVCGSLLTATGDPALALRVAGALMALCVVLVVDPGETSASTGSGAEEAAPVGTERGRPEQPSTGAREFTSALLAVLLGATIGAIWESQFPKGLGAARYLELFGEHYELGVNALLFCLYGGQAACFFALRAWRSWPTSRALVRGATLLLCVGQVLAVFVASVPICALGLCMSGVALGCFFSKCLWLAQHGRRDAARRSGIHESALSLGSVVGPPLGGLLAVVTASLHAPFVLAALLAAGAAAQALLRARRTPDGGH